MYTGMLECRTPINWDQGIMALVAAAASTGIATLAACFNQLRAKPAELMRPEAPKSGKRVFLERVTFLWKRLTFTHKSTLRNLIRYKKRFFMTIIGIGGCMALMLVGFGLEDSITEIAKRQYVEIFTYDAAVTLNGKATDQELEEFEQAVEEREEIGGSLQIYQTSVDLQAGDNTRSAYLYVPSDTQKIADYLTLKDRKTGQSYEYPQEGVALAEKTAKMLGVSVGDTIEIKTSEDSTPVSVQVTEIVENYIQHYAFLSPATYQELFGEETDYNTMYLNYKEEYKEGNKAADKESSKTDNKEGSKGDQTVQERELGRDLMNWEACSGISFVSDLEDQIQDMLQSLNVVIYVLICSAGLLAFVVLYNLNSINITERQRELATLKVLGFYDGEVAWYVYRENILLTIIGILVGVGMGAALHRVTILTVEVDLMMFGRVISFPSYLKSGVITLLFSVLVNAVMFYRLRRINMIESLKSVE
jgi:putative ABC transport system permease protein